MDKLTIKKNTVVEFHYTLKDDSGAVLESSVDEHPTAVLHGHHNIIRGVEDALAGHENGDHLEITVPPALGYGPRKDDHGQRVSKKYFKNPKALKVGTVQQLQTDQGARSVTITKIGGKMVDVDLNHPLAGKTLHFEIDIVDVRAATREEVTHGHAHGQHGHHH